MYSNNIGNEPPRRKGLLGRLVNGLESTLDWVHGFRKRNDWFGSLNQRIRPPVSPPSRPEPPPNLPQAELTEEERKQAVEEIRGRPRIG